MYICLKIIKLNNMIKLNNIIKLNKKVNRLIFISVSATTLLFASCKKLEFDKITQTSWNPNLAVPLAHAKFGVYDILALQDSNDLVVTNPITGAISLVYSGEVFSTDAQSIIQLPNQSETFSITPAELTLLPNVAFNSTINSSISEEFSVNPTAGVEIHSLELKEGMMAIQVNTTLQHDITLDIKFPAFKINGTPITRTLNLTYPGSVPHAGAVNVNLQDAIADLTLNGTTVNRLEVEIDATITGTGEVITGTENLNVSLNLTDLEFENATGYFGQQSLAAANDSILIRLFQNATTGHFELTNPKVNFTIENSFGCPIQLNLNDLKTINVATGQEIPLTNYPSTININTPASLGQTAITTVNLNTSNTGNLSTLISTLPKYFYFESSAESNPNGPTANLNFIEDDSRLRIKAELDLPLEGLAYGFALKDTVDFNVGTDVDLIEYVLFRLIVDNGFPIDLVTQIKFMNANHVPLFTVFGSPETLVEAALVDANGRVNQRTKKISDVVLEAYQIGLLDQVKFLEIEGVAQTLNGTQGQIVKLFDDYTIGVKLSMQVVGKTNF